MADAFQGLLQLQVLGANALVAELHVLLLFAQGLQQLHLFPQLLLLSLKLLILPLKLSHLGTRKAHGHHYPA